MNWIYALLIVFGFLPFFIVLYKMNRFKKIKLHGVSTTATVKQAPYVGHKRLNRIVIQYEVKETGRMLNTEIVVAGIPYTEGQTLTVYYYPQYPHKVILDGGKSFVFGLVFTLIIAAFIIAACFMINKGIEAGEL
ncbi:MAG: DUF3592 domain-containing protein [Ferruginibacter sp.]